LLEMARQRAVAEAESTGFIDDVDDPARSHDVNRPTSNFGSVQASCHVVAMTRRDKESVRATLSARLVVRVTREGRFGSPQAGVSSPHVSAAGRADAHTLTGWSIPYMAEAIAKTENPMTRPMLMRRAGSSASLHHLMRASSRWA
jgi:hypothetical protein